MSFTLDPFQEEAISYISKDENVLITAKTGSGKTLIGEYQIKHSLNKGKRVFYTTPIKSLSNQKFHDLKKVYGDRVGIMTGDIKFAPQADIVIMTTEILRNLLYKQGTPTENIGITSELSLNNLDAVVFDEVHYINDPERGCVWEECLVLLPSQINLVLLSATLNSPEPFVEWLTTIKQKPCHLISTQYRVVPLIHQTEDGDVIMDSKDVFHLDTYKKWYNKYYSNQDKLQKHKERVQTREEGQVIEREIRVGSFLDRMNKLILKLDKPALFFVFSRKQCEEFASKVSTDLLTSSETADVKHIVKFHLHKHDELQHIEGFHKLNSLLEKGIAFHHSGMLPILKEIVEILFDKGFIKILFATETFAVGINMPTKTVVFTSFTKFEDTRRVLRTSEYIQMAGRAGRRGKDDKGIVIYLPIYEPEEPFVVREMMTGKQATVESQMKFDYSYILATMNSNKHIQNETYWAYQKKQETEDIDNQLMMVIVQKENKLKNTYADCNTKYSLQESIKNSVNAEKRRYQGLLSKWENSHMGPKWVTAWKEYLEYKNLETEQNKLYLKKKEIMNLNLEEQIHFLRTYGYITDDVLSKKGLCASEIHEGHPILVTELYYQEINPDDVIDALCCFLEEPITDEVIKQTIIGNKLRDLAHGMNIECSISDYWIDVVHDWLEGYDFVCEKYGIEHGNFVRAMLKLANMTREWINIATLNQDTDMIQKMIGVEQKLIRGFVIPDSLYLRI